LQALSVRVAVAHRLARRTFAGVLIGLTSGWVLAEDDAQVANTFYQYSNEQLEAVCAGMSPSSYVSGLTDGAWVALPFGGRTYYYKSACYYELARRTGRVELCKHVRERKTLFGDGAAYSERSCERMVAASKAANHEQQVAADHHAAAVKGAFKIRAVDTSTLPNGDWQITAHTEGLLSGAYRFEIERLNARKLLAAQAVELSGPGSYTWVIERQDVMGNTPLPAIFPIAISLYYKLPLTSPYPNEKHLSSIQNVTLSAP
jgi:hypothetical protein